MAELSKVARWGARGCWFESAVGTSEFFYVVLYVPMITIKERKEQEEEDFCLAQARERALPVLAAGYDATADKLPP